MMHVILAIKDNSIISSESKPQTSIVQTLDTSLSIVENGLMQEMKVEEKGERTLRVHQVPLIWKHWYIKMI